MNLIYSLHPLHRTLNHDRHVPAMLHDGAEQDARVVDVQVRSGDYFATLATTLDRLSHDVSPDDEVTQNILQKLVTDLLYLQQHYEIKKKQP